MKYFIVLISGCIIPRRFIFGILGLVGVFSALSMRICLNVAITQMIKHSEIEEKHYDPDACPAEIVVGNFTVIEKPVSNLLFRFVFYLFTFR